MSDSHVDEQALLAGVDTLANQPNQQRQLSEEELYGNEEPAEPYSPGQEYSPDDDEPATSAQRGSPLHASSHYQHPSPPPATPAAPYPPSSSAGPLLPLPSSFGANSRASSGVHTVSSSTPLASTPTTMYDDSSSTPKKVYVENLPLPTSEDVLHSLFSSFGSIHRIHIGSDRSTGKQLGFAFIEFERAEAGMRAIEAVQNGMEVQGRMLRASVAKRKTGTMSAGGSGGGGAGGGSSSGSTRSGPPPPPPNAIMAGPPLNGLMVPPAPMSAMMNPMMPSMAGMPAMPGMMSMTGQMGLPQPMPMMMQPMMPAAMMAPPMPVPPLPSGMNAPLLPTVAAAPNRSTGGEGPPSPNIFVNGLPYSYNEADLEALFSPCGRIHSVKLLVDPASGKSKGCGFVHFTDAPSALAAIQSWNGKKAPHSDSPTFLQVRFAFPKKDGGGSVAGGGGGESVSSYEQASSYSSSSRHDHSHHDSTSNYGPDRKLRTHQRHNPMARSQPHHHPSPTLSATPSPSPLPSNAPLMDHQQYMNERGEICLFVFYLPKTITNDELHKLFAVYGYVSEVSIPKDKQTGESKGFAFVNMREIHEAQRAIQHLNGYQVNGKRLKVSFKVANRPGGDRGAAGGGRSGGMQSGNIPNMPMNHMMPPAMSMGTMMGAPGGGGMMPMQAMNAMPMQPMPAMGMGGMMAGMPMMPMQAMPPMQPMAGMAPPMPQMGGMMPPMQPMMGAPMMPPLGQPWQ